MGSILLVHYSMIVLKYLTVKVSYPKHHFQLFKYILTRFESLMNIAALDLYFSPYKVNKKFLSERWNQVESFQLSKRLFLYCLEKKIFTG